jgi:hypothetical protein
VCFRRNSSLVSRLLTLLHFSVILFSLLPHPFWGYVTAFYLILSKPCLYTTIGILSMIRLLRDQPLSAVLSLPTSFLDPLWRGFTLQSLCVNSTILTGLSSTFLESSQKIWVMIGSAVRFHITSKFALTKASHLCNGAVYRKPIIKHPHWQMTVNGRDNTCYPACYTLSFKSQSQAYWPQGFCL